jgi:GntR family transcriptional regulator
MTGKAEIPLYGRVQGVLSQEIKTGMLPSGTQLPTEDALIERFGISRITVRRAIQELVAQGLVEIRRGVGTFVAPPKISQDLTQLTGFVEDMQAHGRSASARLIDTEVVDASESVASRLGLSRGTRVMRIKRVRVADGVSMSLDDTYLPLAIGKLIIKNDLQVEPIFTLLENKYQIPLIAADYRMEAVAAEPWVALELGVAEGSPIFLIERTSYTTGNKPVDHERLYYRGDLIRFVTRLVRKPTQ